MFERPRHDAGRQVSAWQEIPYPGTIGRGRRAPYVLFRDTSLGPRGLAPDTCTSRWGEPYTVEQMLEHAVVRPMRHRIQLERLMVLNVSG